MFGPAVSALNSNFVVSGLYASNTPTDPGGAIAVRFSAPSVVVTCISLPSTTMLMPGKALNVLNFSTLPVFPAYMAAVVVGIGAPSAKLETMPSSGELKDFRVGFDSFDLMSLAIDSIVESLFGDLADAADAADADAAFDLLPLPLRFAADANVVGFDMFSPRRPKTFSIRSASII